MTKDENKINQLTKRFFSLFTNINGQKANVRDLESFFLPTGIIINNTSKTPAIYSMNSFIEPREKLLSSGDLVDFQEWETSHKTEIHNNIANRTCKYEKSGKLNGENFKGRGVKMMQFVKSEERWILTSVIWTDEK